MENIKISLIDHNDSFTYNIVEMLRKIDNIDHDVISIDKIDVNKLENYDNIILSPGPGLPADYPKLREIIKTYKTSIPILGICLGHQAICEFFGARLDNLQSVYHGYQQRVELVDGSKLFRDIDSNFYVGLYHSWVMSDDNIPAELKITSFSEKGYVMSVEHREYNIYGIQFHPESFMTSRGLEIIKNFIFIQD